MTLPPWVLDRLVRDGTLTERLTSRRARARACRRCGAGVISGLDADWCALDVDCSPVPLTVGGAVSARIAGLPVVTFNTWGRPQLDWTTGLSTPPWGVYLLHRHRCGLRTPDAWRAPSDRKSAPADDGDVPPF